MAKTTYSLTPSARLNYWGMLGLMTLLLLVAVVLSIISAYIEQNWQQLISIPLALAFYGFILWYLADAVTAIVQDGEQLVFRSLLGADNVAVNEIQRIARPTFPFTNTRVFDMIKITTSSRLYSLPYRFTDIDTLLGQLKALNPHLAVTDSDSPAGKDKSHPGNP